MGRFVDEGTSPCKHCADRTLGCHGICKDYVEWQEMVAKRRRWLRKQKAQTAIHKGSFTGTTPPPGKHVDKFGKKVR